MTDSGSQWDSLASTLGGSGKAPGGTPYGDLTFLDGKMEAVKRTRSKRRRCDWCLAMHRKCIITKNAEDPKAPCDYCIKNNKPCTYDRSRPQIKSRHYRPRKSSVAKPAERPKSEAEGGPLSLTNNSFNPLSNSFSTVQQFAPDAHLANNMLDGYLLTDHSPTIAPYQLPVIPYPNRSPFSVQPPSFESALGLDSPSLSRTIHYSQLASQTASSVPSLDSSSPLRPVDWDYTRLGTQLTSFAPSLDSSSLARPMDYTQLETQPPSFSPGLGSSSFSHQHADHLIAFGGRPSFELSTSRTTEQSQSAMQSTSFEGVPSSESPSFSRTMDHAQPTLQSTSFNGISSPANPSFSRFVDPAIIEAQFGSRIAHMNEDESTETEDLYSLADRAVRNLREAEEDGIIPRREYG